MEVKEKKLNVFFRVLVLVIGEIGILLIKVGGIGMELYFGFEGDSDFIFKNVECKLEYLIV